MAVRGACGTCKGSELEPRACPCPCIACCIVCLAQVEVPGAVSKIVCALWFEGSVQSSRTWRSTRFVDVWSCIAEREDPAKFQPTPVAGSSHSAGASEAGASHQPFSQLRPTSVSASLPRKIHAARTEAASGLTRCRGERDRLGSGDWYAYMCVPPRYRCSFVSCKINYCDCVECSPRFPALSTPVFIILSLKP